MTPTKKAGRAGRKLPTAELVQQGNRLRDSGDWVRAEETYRLATDTDPHWSDAWVELGCLLMDGRRFSEAATCFQRTPEVSRAAEVSRDGMPNNPQQTVRALLQIAATGPDWARGQFSLGCAYEHLREYDPARTHLANVLRLDASRKAAVESLYARMYWLEGKWTEGIAAADRALAANPTYYLALVIRSRCCSALGRMPEAVENNRRALEILPEPTIHSDLLFEMNYLADTTPETLFAEACCWNSLYAAPLASRIQPHTNPPDPDRRLKVGYVSPDLYQHTIMKFLPPLFEHHDRSRVEVFVYAVGSKSDHISESLRELVENYASMRGPYSELAERVRRDGIDILVDLAGHSMGSAFPAFALKPAPVQVSWMGFESTTGMAAMDYFLGDAQLPCPGTEAFFSETVYRLPKTECCFRPIGNVPVGPAPCLERGYITFGCFNNPQKITREVAMLWSAVLHLVRDSRLLLKFHRLETEVRQAPLREWFQANGIEPKRVLFEGRSDPTQYLAAYNGIDIALDPFPYNGGSTTLDALWMGVPVVSLAGQLAVQRGGASVLTAAGWPDLVAHTPELYLKIALFLAATVAKEPELRCDIRKALLASPLMDEVGLVRSLEDAFRDMWRTWCRTKS